MKKAMVMILLLMLAGSVLAGPLTTLWEKSDATGTLPGWFDTSHLTRGFAYGVIDGQDRLAVVSRNGGSYIYILDAASGDSLARLDNTGITGGTYYVSDVGISDDGKIYVCNLSLNSAFKVYVWDSVSSAPVNVISHTHSGRLGDKITVMGSIADNTFALYAASAGTVGDILMFTTSDNGSTFTADTIATMTAFGGAAAVGPEMVGGPFWYNYNGLNPKKYSASGTLMGTVSGGVVGTGSNAIRHITFNGTDELAVTFAYGAGNENARIFSVPDGVVEDASLYIATPSLGDNANANGAGDVAVQKIDDLNYNVYVLSTNNGLGAYKVTLPVAPEAPVNMTSNWQIWADYTPWLLSSGDAMRGMGYDPATASVLAPSRANGNLVRVLDGETGALIDTLDMTGVSGGTFILNKAIADADGVIYLCNLALANGNFKIYRYADITAAPTEIVNGTWAVRLGDEIEVVGTGADTKILASARDGSVIKVFETADGLTFTEGADIPIAAGSANGGISAVNDSTFWINAAWKDMQKIDLDGNILQTVGSDVVDTYYGSVKYIMAENGAELLVTNTNHSAGNRRKIQVINLSAVTPEVWASAETGNIEASNGNVAGNLAYDYNTDGSVTLWALATNNAVSSWKVEVPDVYISLDMTSMDFGQVAVNSAIVMDLTVTNLGSGAFILDSVRVDNDLFSVDFDDDSTLTGNASAVIPVKFAPETGSFETGTLTIYTAAGPFTVDLMAEGFILWPLTWRTSSSDAGWIGTANETRGAAYNPATGHILIPSRVGSPRLVIVDSETGDSLGLVDTRGVSEGGLPINTVAVTSDGQIYLASLAYASGQAFKVYHFASEADTPVVVYRGIHSTDFDVRLGDVLAVAGTGSEVTIFSSGNGASKIVTISTTDGVNYSKGSDIILPEADAARLGIAPVDAEYMFINGPAKAPRYINRDGDELYTFDTALIPSGTSINYFTVDTPEGATRQFVGVTNGWSSGTTVVELLGTAGTGLCSDIQVLDAPTDNYSSMPNGNATGLAMYDIRNNALVEFITNNGISSYSFENVAISANMVSGFTMPDTVTFSAVAVNASETQSFMLVNDGMAPITVYGAAADDEAFSSGIADTTVAAGDTLVIYVTFTPDDEMEYLSEMTLMTNAGDFSVTLSAEGYIFWTNVWLKKSTDEDMGWFYQAGIAEHMVRSAAYNPVNNHIYAVSRIGGSFVYVLDGQTGEMIGALDNTGITGGGYYINLLDVAEDGQIFVGNLAYSAGQAFKVYRYADEFSVPEVVYNGTFEDFGARVGDAFAVSGSGTDITVFISGSGNSNIGVLTMDQTGMLAHTSDIALPEVSAAYLGISPAGDGYIFTNGSGKAPRYMKTDGTVLHTFDTSAMPSGTSIEYFETALADTVRRFVAITNGWSPGATLVELLGEPGDGLCGSYAVAPAPTDKYSSVANGNATGVTFYNSYNNHLVELITNNGIAAYDMDVVEENIVRNDIAVASTEPRMLLFDTILSSESAEGDFSVTNYGTADLVLNGINISNAAFTVSPMTATVTPGSSQTFTVTFAPAGLDGEVEGDITLLFDNGIDLVSVMGNSLDIQGNVIHENFAGWTTFGNGWTGSNAAWWDLAGYGRGDAYFIGGDALNAPVQIFTPQLVNAQKLLFYYAEYSGGTDDWTLYVVTTKDGVTFEDTLGAFTPPGNLDWVQVSIDLDLAGDYSIGFVTSETVTGSIYLDDVLVDAAGKAIEGTAVNEDFSIWTSFTGHRWGGTNVAYINDPGYGHNDDHFIGSPYDNLDKAVTIITPKVTDPTYVSFWFAQFGSGDSWTMDIFLSEDAVTFVDTLAMGIQNPGSLDWTFAGLPIDRSGDLMVVIRVSDPVSGGIFIDDMKIDGDAVVGIEGPAVPENYDLSQNYPNPFNPSTSIRLALPEAGMVELSVYNILGQKIHIIKNAHMEAGYHTFTFNVGNLASGIYFYRVQVNDFHNVRKMTILK